MKGRTKVIFAIGVIFLIYGFLSRILNIYFFWDSKTFGWMFLFVAFISYLSDLRSRRLRQGKKIFWVTLFGGFLLLGIPVIPFVIYELKTSEAYQSAVDFIKSDSLLQKEIGSIRGFGLIPTGAVTSITTTTTINGTTESGTAILEIIVKGKIKYKDVTLHLNKSNNGWEVTYVE